VAPSRNAALSLEVVTVAAESSISSRLIETLRKCRWEAEGDFCAFRSLRRRFVRTPRAAKGIIRT
jgi:hypothetical protein